MSIVSVHDRSGLSLNSEQVEQFHQQGYLGPFALCSPDEMTEILRRVDEQVLSGGTPFNASVHQSRHLDRRVVWELCSHPAIVERMKSLYGPDLVLWRSCFFDKQPGGKEIPWHQDLNYWPIEPVVNITAWVALTEAVVSNSCVQLIPGSHRTVVPHIAATEGQAFAERADPAHFDAGQCVNMELKPGEFFLFTEKLLHHSEPNTSDRRRCGLAVRVTVPFVKVEHDKLFAGHKCIQLCGRDPLGFNQLADPPAA